MHRRGPRRRAVRPGGPGRPPGAGPGGPPESGDAHRLGAPAADAAGTRALWRRGARRRGPRLRRRLRHASAGLGGAPGASGGGRVGAGAATLRGAPRLQQRGAQGRAVHSRRRRRRGRAHGRAPGPGQRHLAALARHVRGEDALRAAGLGRPAVRRGGLRRLQLPSLGGVLRSCGRPLGAGRPDVRGPAGGHGGRLRGRPLRGRRLHRLQVVC
mmetsp:Transcript_15476/g.42722  ORF Transcript_15476/g.42722 Transcript_15476/m.42722 type:complete len:213 (-) Transcript_15476:374-1012(-)